MSCKVRGHPDFVRDARSGAIVNQNTKQYEQFLKSKRSRRLQSERINNLEERLSNIETLLKELLEKK